MIAFNYQSMAVLAVAMLFSTSVVFASSRYDNTTQFAVPAQQTVVTEQDRQLSELIIATLQADAKLAGLMELSNRNGAIVVSGKVASVAMIYRVVELTRNLPGVRSVDVSKLDT